MMEKGFYHIINECAKIRKDERVLLIFDDSTEYLKDHFKEPLQCSCKSLSMEKVESTDVHGLEPSIELREKMLSSDAILCLTKSSLAHTDARKMAEMKGIRFLSLPGYDEKLLCSNALFVNYQEIYPLVQSYTELLNQGEMIRLYTEKGTDVTMNISGREGNCCPGFVEAPSILLGSPPDIEANIAPVEEDTNGRIVIDGSITHPEIGKLEEPIVLEICAGRIREIISGNERKAKKLRTIFSDVCSPKAYILAELGIGFNPEAELCGNMLIDEGARGCVHFGFGANHTINGKNKVGFHLDCVITEPTVEIDGHICIKKGELLNEQ